MGVSRDSQHYGPLCGEEPVRGIHMPVHCQEAQVAWQTGQSLNRSVIRSRRHKCGPITVLPFRFAISVWTRIVNYVTTGMPHPWQPETMTNSRLPDVDLELIAVLSFPGEVSLRRDQSRFLTRHTESPQWNFLFVRPATCCCHREK